MDACYFSEFDAWTHAISRNLMHFAPNTLHRDKQKLWRRKDATNCHGQAVRIKALRSKASDASGFGKAKSGLFEQCHAVKR